MYSANKCKQGIVHGSFMNIKKMQINVSKNCDLRTCSLEMYAEHQNKV